VRSCVWFCSGRLAFQSGAFAIGSILLVVTISRARAFALLLLHSIRRGPQAPSWTTSYAEIAGRFRQTNFAVTKMSATKHNTMTPAQKYIGNVQRLYRA